uniref:Obg domain-containing protein n=1 Tax=Romanomermis culicivorax TaxID=13658 RepID=A0A915K002_ROMCU
MGFVPLPRKWHKARAEGNSDAYFVDFKRVTVQGGNGGDGTISFARLWCNPFAGPDGADGGNGGHCFSQTPGASCNSYC